MKVLNGSSDSDDDLKLQHSESQKRLQASLARFAFQTPLKNQKVCGDPNPKIVSQEQIPSKKRQRTSSLQKLTPDPIVPALDSNQVSFSSSETITPAKRRKPKHVKGESPEVCRHLPKLQDYLEDNLEVVFCGINPGKRSAKIGHHFGGFTNHFWVCLHESGFTPRRFHPEEDSTLPQLFIGLTNLVDTPTAQESELTSAEKQAGVSIFLQKISRYRPLIVSFVGLGIARVVQREILGKPVGCSEATVGLQPYKLVYSSIDSGNFRSRARGETLFYAVSSTSGRVVHYQVGHSF